MDEALRPSPAGYDAGGARAAAPLVAPLLAGLGIALSLAAAGEVCAQQSAGLRLKRAQEIAPFRLTGYDGYMVTRYISDEAQTAGQASGANQRQRMRGHIEEINLVAHSYIYHPSLITLDIGGGPVIDKTKYDAEGVATDFSRKSFNFNGRATVLRDKPYTGSVFFDHRNQTQALGPAQFMQTETDRYGFEFGMRSPAIRTPLHFDVEHYANKGRGADQVLNDSTDRLRYRLEGNIGTLGHTVFQSMNTRQQSESGSPGLPIHASSNDSDRLNLDTRLKLGDKRQYDVINVVTYNNQRYASSQGPALNLSDFRFSLDGRARHSEDLHSYANFNNASSKQGEQDTSLNALGGGVSYRINPALTGTLAARGESGKAGPAASTLYGTDGSLQYRYLLPVGEARLGYNFGYMQREQEAAAQQARVIDERVVLGGTDNAPLKRTQVVAGSVTVSNLTRTQVFVDGADYRLTVVGTGTRIQRLIGGNILDGQEVLIDYAYEVGGSYALNQLDQSVSASWSYKSYLTTFVRFADSAPHLTSGTPTFQLNPAKSTTVGTRGEVPVRVPYDLVSDLRLGGYAERENRHEVISPYQRGSMEGYALMALPWVRSGEVRLGSRRMQVVYDYSPLGVDLKALDLRLSARLPWNVVVSLDASKERDTGAVVPRERSFVLARVNWRKRKLQWSFDLNRTHDVQGANERTRTYAQLMLRRDL